MHKKVTIRTFILISLGLKSDSLTAQWWWQWILALLDTTSPSVPWPLLERHSDYVYQSYQVTALHPCFCKEPAVEPKGTSARLLLAVPTGIHLTAGHADCITHYPMDLVLLLK